MKKCKCCCEEICEEATKCSHCQSEQPREITFKEDVREMFGNFMPQKFSEFILWFFIPVGIFSMVLCWGGKSYLWVGLIPLLMILGGRVYKIKPVNIITAASILIASIGVCIQANTQREQSLEFAMMNRARLVLGVEGDVRNGNINLVNVGNLPGEDLVLVWEIIKIENNIDIPGYKDAKKQIIKSLKQGVERKKDIDVDEKTQIAYSSSAGLNDETVLLIISWKYSGRGINRPRAMDVHFLWDVKREPHAWVSTSILSAEHIDAVTQEKKRLSDLLQRKNAYLEKTTV
ncbi:MAG: hypothetical protein V1882_02485 [Candidatus Omnitrophota bacterium]